MDRRELVDFLDDYLRIRDVLDYGPQGLQVEADKTEVVRLALAVDVAPAIIQAAAAWQADMLLVHHGIFWGSQEPIAGPLGRRVRLLLQHGIHLYSAHLALDAHPEVGNNAVLARLFGVDIATWWCAPKDTPLGVCGRLGEPSRLQDFVQMVGDRLAVEPRVLAHGPEVVRQVAILSGFGADEVPAARAVGADTFITGETSHAHFWAAADHEINVIFAGHYATETVGVQALGEHLARQFGLEVRFFDFPTVM